MSLNNNFFMFRYLPLIIIAFIGFITPFLLKENIIFGSRFPNEIKHHRETKILKKNFKYTYISIYIPLVILLGLFLYYSPGSGYFTIGAAAEIFVNFIIYSVYNKKAKELKKELLEDESIPVRKEILTVDTGFREGKYLISIWWFLPSLAVIVFNFLILLLKYKNIPERIALHFDFNGAATLTAGKTYFNVLLMPLTSLFIFFTFILTYFSIKISKQDIDSNRPVTSKLRDRHFRLIWSDYSVIICTSLVTWMMFVSFKIAGFLTIPGNIFTLFNFGIPVLFLIGAVLLAVKTGQSGSKLKIKMPEVGTGLNNIDDDSYWKLGMIYYNPGDPTIFVPKRFGVGWTINMGRPAGLVMLVAIFAFIIISIIVSRK